MFVSEWRFEHPRRSEKGSRGTVKVVVGKRRARQHQEQGTNIVNATGRLVEYGTTVREVAGSKTPSRPILNLSTRVFETRTVTGNELFSLLICLRTTTFTLLSIFS